MWCAYSACWLDIESFSLEQRRAPRSERYSMNYSEPVSRQNRVPVRAATDAVCYDFFRNGLSSYGKDMLAANDGVGSAAEMVYRDQWDAEDDAAAARNAGPDVRSICTDLQFLELTTDGRRVPGLDCTAWRAALQQGMDAANVATQVQAAATAFEDFLRALDGEGRSLMAEVNVDQILQRLTAANGRQTQLRALLFEWVPRIYAEAGVDSLRRGKPRSKGYRRITASDTAELGENWSLHHGFSKRMYSDQFASTMSSKRRNGNGSLIFQVDGCNISPAEHKRLTPAGPDDGWFAVILPLEKELAAAEVDRLRTMRLLPDVSDDRIVAVNGQMPWRCSKLLETSDNGNGCAITALTKIMASTAGQLKLYTDAVLKLKGAAGEGCDFFSLSQGLLRLRQTDAPAGAVVLRHFEATITTILLALFGAYIFGGWYRTRNGKIIGHAVSYNADARLLHLGPKTLAIMAKDLLDVPKLLDEIERDTGIFFEGDIDCRQIYICPMHPGAQELPYHPKEHLKAPPISGRCVGGNRRKRKQQAAARAADDGSGR